MNFSLNLNFNTLNRTYLLGQLGINICGAFPRDLITIIWLAFFRNCFFNYKKNSLSSFLHAY